MARDHIEQRQTIVNVRDNADDKLITAHRERTQEREVRLAARPGP